MTPQRGSGRRLAAALAALAIAGAARAAPAQEADAIEAAVIAGAARAAPAQEAGAIEAVVDPNAFILHEHQFNNWAFGNVASADDARRNLEAKLTASVNDIERTCELPPAIRGKLELAGRGDIERFFDEVEQKRDELQGKSFDQQKIGEIYQQLQPLQRRYNLGLFGDGSLFAKVAATILDSEQASRYEDALRRRREYQYRAKIELFVTRLSDSLGLDDSQRERFIEAILEQTRTPRRFGGQYDEQIVRYKASQVPEDALRPIFDDAQWQILSLHLQQGRGNEQFLKSNGYLDEDEGDDGRDRPRD